MLETICKYSTTSDGRDKEIVRIPLLPSSMSGYLFLTFLSKMWSNVIKMSSKSLLRLWKLLHHNFVFQSQMKNWDRGIEVNNLWHSLKVINIASFKICSWKICLFSSFSHHNSSLKTRCLLLGFEPGAGCFRQIHWATVCYFSILYFRAEWRSWTEEPNGR